MTAEAADAGHAAKVQGGGPRIRPPNTCADAVMLMVLVFESHHESLCSLGFRYPIILRI